MSPFRARSGPRPRLQFTSEGVKAPGTGHNRLVKVTISDEKKKFVTKYGSCWQAFIGIHTWINVYVHIVFLHMRIKLDLFTLKDFLLYIHV
jgi:hypothetical protein